MRLSPLAGSALFALGSLTLLTSACSSQQPADSLPKKAKPLQEDQAGAPQLDGESEARGQALPWEPQTFSPRPGSVFDPELEALEGLCGQGDVALHEVATYVAERHAQAGEAPQLDEVSFHLRRRGTPYVMPRMWSASMTGVSAEKVAEAVGQWAASHPSRGSVRCGIGMAPHEDGGQTITVLQVDVLAELLPLPTQIAAGSFVDLEARFLEPTTSASVVVLPPQGRPHTVNIELERDTAKTRLSLPVAGTWLVQVMATQEGGPLPVASALITADKAPPSAPDSRPVPGEDAFDPNLPADEALFVLMNAARKKENLPPLRRNRTADRVAAEHCEAMIRQGRISHDTGGGSPARRAEAAGLRTQAIGENVALAGSVPRLHRALWASPSHRENLLLRRWEEAGVAVVARDDGSLFATQLFLDH